MLRNAIIVLLMPLFFNTAGAAHISDRQLESMLDSLDTELTMRNDYARQRIERINKIKKNMSSKISGKETLRMLMEIGNEYNAFNNDSALRYYTYGYNMALAAGNDAEAMKFRLRRATFLPLSGFIKDAVDEFDAIDPTEIPDSLKVFYHDSGRQLCSYIASFFEKYPTTKEYWESLADTHRDSLLTLLDPASTSYALNRGEDLLVKHDYMKARDILMGLFKTLNPDSNQFARAAHMLATISIAEGNETDAAYYLAKSAMADTKGAVLEVMSLQELGEMLSRSGDIDRAYNYLSIALDNAVDCNATMRIVQSSTILPIIQKAHTAQARQWRTRIYIIIILLVVALASVAVSIIMLRRRMRRINMLKNKLQSANQVKEIYISQFFRLCSIYIDRLNQFCKIANRKISSGQIDDLYKMTKNGKLVEDQSAEFYKLFDDAFLHIYPTFVEDVNKLLRDKIVLREGELLNNDLRLLAFMRLGLEDTNQVALILNYSVNTIYAYRNKLRNRAYDRDNFEKDIMSIGSI